MTGPHAGRPRDRGFDLNRGRRFLPQLRNAQPGFEPPQLPVWCVPGAVFPGGGGAVAMTTHLHIVPSP
jgi:hypothetical protein